MAYKSTGSSHGGYSQLERMQDQVDQTTGIMASNLQKVHDRGEKIEDLGHKAGQLEDNAKLFKKTARDHANKMRWKSIKLWVVLFIILLVIAAVIVAITVIVVYSKK